MPTSKESAIRMEDRPGTLGVGVAGARLYLDSSRVELGVADLYPGRKPMKRMLWAVLLILLAIAEVQAAETPSPALLVLNKEENTLAIVDPATRRVVGRVPTGEAPHEVAVSADGRLAFVANYGSQNAGNTISVIDLVA